MQLARRSKSNHVEWALALDRPKLDEPVLRVGSVMSKAVFTCSAGDSLNVAAQIMWDHDCGCVPVIDGARRVVGIITDRDLCMAASKEGRPLHEIAVSDVCSREVHACHHDELVSNAARTMADVQVRRLPVIDADGRLVGILALSDLVRNLCFARPHGGFADAQRMVVLLEAVSRPRLPIVECLPHMSADEKESLAQFDAP